MCCGEPCVAILQFKFAVRTAKANQTLFDVLYIGFVKFFVANKADYFVTIVLFCLKMLSKAVLKTACLANVHLFLTVNHVDNGVVFAPGVFSGGIATIFIKRISSQFHTSPYNSVYFFAVPFAFSTGYFSPFTFNLSSTICFTSRWYSFAISRA